MTKFIQRPKTARSEDDSQVATSSSRDAKPDRASVDPRSPPMKREAVRGEIRKVLREFGTLTARRSVPAEGGVRRAPASLPPTRPRSLRLAGLPPPPSVNFPSPEEGGKNIEVESDFIEKQYSADESSDDDDEVWTDSFINRMDMMWICLCGNANNTDACVGCDGDKVTNEDKCYGVGAIWRCAICGNIQDRRDCFNIRCPGHRDQIGIY